MNPEVIRSLLAAGLLDQATADILQRQSDPILARQWAEGQLSIGVQGGLSAQQGRLLDLVTQSNMNPSPSELEAFWTAEDALLWQAISPQLLNVVSERATLAAVTAGQADTFHLINQAVIQWAEDYYINPDGGVFGSVPNLNLHSRTIFSRAFLEWQQGELEVGKPNGLPQLIDALTPIFGPVRAEAIAQSEVTRIFVQSQLESEKNNPFTVAWRYFTSNDGERVCPVCAPANGTVTEKGSSTFPDGGGFPPRHPRCRCGISPETLQTLNVPFRG